MVGDAFLSKVFFQSCKTVLLFAKAIVSLCLATKKKYDPGMFRLEVLKYQTSS